MVAQNSGKKTVVWLSDDAFSLHVLSQPPVPGPRRRGGEGREGREGEERD